MAWEYCTLREASLQVVNQTWVRTTFSGLYRQARIRCSIKTQKWDAPIRRISLYIEKRNQFIW